MACLSFVHPDAFTKLVQLIGCSPVVVAEIMEVNGNAHFFQHHDAVHHVYSAAVISGPGCIKAYYVQVAVHLLKQIDRKQVVFFLRFAS